VVPGVTAALAAAADTQRPLTRRGTGRSVSLHTAMTQQGALQAPTLPTPRSSTWPAGSLPHWAGNCGKPVGPIDTPVCVVSRAGWPDSLCSDHDLASLAQAALLHAGRPTVVTVGVGAQTVPAAPKTPLIDTAQCNSAPLAA
jgi:uroporphyrin-III C-methyltransferase